MPSLYVRKTKPLTLEQKKQNTQSSFVKYRRSPKYLETMRRAHLKNKYGLTPEQYDAMLSSQNGVCAICFRPETSKRWTRLSVDHNHATKQLRGLLCHGCNKALGLLQESTARLNNAIEYLKKYSQGELP
jgi:hypothetical protein